MNYSMYIIIAIVITDTKALKLKNNYCNKTLATFLLTLSKYLTKLLLLLRGEACEQPILQTKINDIIF